MGGKRFRAHFGRRRIRLQERWNMERVDFKIQMLGDFLVTYKDKILVSENNRNNKVIHLFQYLLVNHGHSVRQDELISRLFLDAEDYDNPVHTLKNIVYRLRKYLKECGLPDVEYIFYKKGAYGLNGEIECLIDAEFFEKAVESARESTDPAEKLDHCLAAVALYDGDFLPKSSHMFWVVPKSLHFQQCFHYCIDTAFEILQSKGDLSSMLDILEKALYLYPYEEHFHALRISCLYQLGKVKEAVREYDFATTLLFDELGISPSAEMLALYEEMTQTLHSAADSLHAILEDLNENIMEKGAYYCNYQVFANIYRIVVRHSERSGRSAFVALIDFEAREEIKDGKKQTDSGALFNAVQTSLRRGDVFARYSPTQFIVLLMDINQENSKKVMARISDRFYKQSKSRRFTWKLASAIDVDRIFPVRAAQSAAAVK
jgi:DNA-binding SARP family transcriptional activator